MQSNTTADNNHRQLLMRCLVTNDQGETTQRFVDHTEFSMWRFLLEQRHNLNVHDPIPCVWVPEEQCRRHDKLFAHAAFHEPVDRLIFEKFDADSGVTETQTRFVLSAELDAVSPVLEGHLVVSTAAVVMETQAGAALSTAPAKRWFTSRPIAAYCAA